MRNLHNLGAYRVRMVGYLQDAHNGTFCIQSKRNGETLRVIATNHEGWDRVSVSLADRCPTWDEMEQIAKLFFTGGEYAFQLHVPQSDHINVHPYCLHWWRPQRTPLPIPPKEMV